MPFEAFIEGLLQAFYSLLPFWLHCALTVTLEGVCDWGAAGSCLPTAPACVPANRALLLPSPQTCCTWVAVQQASCCVSSWQLSVVSWLCVRL